MLTGKRIAILAEENFEDSELTEPLRAMKDAGARVSIVGSAGGYAPDKMRLHQPMVDLVRKAHAEGKIIAAVCHGPQLLISADIVKGRRLTSWPSVAVDLKNAGAIWVDEPVVKDGNIITARKPADLPKFNKAIIEALL